MPEAVKVTHQARLAVLTRAWNPNPLVALSSTEASGE